ncbi:MAG: sulfatase-like hydrolase/transferase [Candidatus Nanopelagicales bacterium]|nr:sulfatase-like hydrolase/transferase [Candidatus Nanopelagicales bacterium]
MTQQRPNILLIMTDQERYPVPYEDEALAEFRRTQLPARQRLIDEGLQFHRHYTGATACAPSRATLFTGHYPSLHGVRSTDGLAKHADDPQMQWLDPDVVPTMGHWLQAAGYRTYYRGKWHISHADLAEPGTHEGLKANDAMGAVLQEMVELYQRTDRLDPFGFTGWIGREPHGADRADTGVVKDAVYRDQVTDMFLQLTEDDDPRPWLAVASFVNPHDITFAGPAWDLLQFPHPDATVPDIPEAPSQSDSFDGRPDVQRQWSQTWPRMAFPIALDNDYRRLYMYLHKLVDAAILSVLDALDAAGLAESTVVVFTSDHGDLIGAHGGMQQKWYNAFDEAIRVPMIIRGPGIEHDPAGVTLPTSHVDLLPTLLGLAGASDDSLLSVVAQRHIEAHPLPGRDLSAVVRDPAAATALDSPVYFMTEDQISQGPHQVNQATRVAFDPVTGPGCVETVITTLSAGADGSSELWKLSRYYELDNPAGVTDLEAYNLTLDPQERANRASDPAAPIDALVTILEQQRASKRLVPRYSNPEAPDAAAALAAAAASPMVQ